MSELLVCPYDRAALVADGDNVLRCTQCGANYPIANGIAIMLPEAPQRERIAHADWSAPSGSERDAIFFYNELAIQHDPNYCRGDVRANAEPFLNQSRCSGMVLEIGSGNGDLQGIGGEDYVALDYSFTALRRFVEPKFTRVCATAETLPFPNASASFIVTLTCLEHVPAADRAFDEIDRVLKPGGVAFIEPAWHCQQYNCDRVSVRPYRELTLRNKLIKLALPVITKPIVRGMVRVPGRVMRRLMWHLTGRRQIPLRFKKLRPYYEKAIIADCDACSSIDSHDACLYFTSRGYEILNPGQSALAQLKMRSAALVVRKPVSAAK